MYSDIAKALKRICVMGIAFLVAWSTVSVFGAGGSNGRGDYLVSLDEDTSPEVFGMIGTKVLVDYGNGLYITQSTESEAISLDRIGSVTKMTNTVDLYPSDITLEPSKGPPTTPSRTRENEWDRETYIVQFVGPYKPEWLEAIKKEEGRIGKIAPTFSAVVKMSPLMKSKISQLPYVQWVGAYYPRYKISSELLDSEGVVRIAVMVFDESQRMEVSRRLVDMGVSVLTSYSPRTIIAYADSELLPWIVSIPEILDVRRDYVSASMDLMSAKIHGAFDSWNASRSGLPSTLTGQSPGPDGVEGTADDYFEVVGIQDTGLDICDEDNGHPDLFKGPNGDRVIRFTDQTGQSCPDGYLSGLSHGTQVVGTVIGNGFAWEYFFGYPTDDDDWEHAEAVGMVPEGKVSFDGIQAFAGLLAMPNYWDVQYADGAHVYVNAFGSPPADYGSDSWAVDERTDVNNDRLMVFAAGNAGPDLNTLTSNSQGKNGLTSAAGLNFRPDRQDAHNPNLVGDFSGRGGPNQSYGRLKPDLVTVGTQAISLMGVGEWEHNEAMGIGNPQPDCIMGVDVYNRNDPDDLSGDGICDYRYYEFGTSVSTPNLGGLTMLVREYLREIGGISDPYQINSQLVKALMINGAVRMDEDLFDYPGYDQGWGSVDLVQSLFPPAPRTNRYEEGVMTTTGVWNPSFSTLVHTDDVPLKITLVWVDLPGKSLFRDLNLRVTSPSGDVHYGNVYGTNGLYDGWSIPNPSPADSNPLWDRVGNDGWDDVNNVEQVEVEFPEPGTWTIEVVGFSIPSDAPFALVVGADFGPQQTYEVGLTTDHPLYVETTQNGDVPFPFYVTNFGSSIDSIALDTSTIPGISIDFENSILMNMKSRETIDTYAVVSAASGVMCGVHGVAIMATSIGDATATDRLDLMVNVKCDIAPRRLQITNSTADEMEPSVLTFNDGSTDHIFIAYRKTAAMAPDNRFGGNNVWVAHTTLDVDGYPLLPFTYTEVSNWNDDPTDLRWMYVPQGVYQNRILLTWVGDDPEAADPDLDSYGVMYYSDPPYAAWNKRIIEKNAGSSTMNEARINIPVWRDDGTAEGEVIWIWEHLDYVNPDANNPVRVQTWFAISRDGGDTWPECNGSDPDCGRVSPYDNSFYFFPDACVDMNDVLWVFFYYRLPAGTDRDLMVRLYDGEWQGSSTPINTNDDVSLLWNTDKTNLQWPTCLVTSEGAPGNRVYAAVANDMGGVDQTIWVGYLQGHYNSSNPPFGLNRTDTSGVSPNFHGPYGPIGISVSSSNWGRGQIFNMVYTNDDYTWVTYIENANQFYAPNLMAAITNDAFSTLTEYSTLTADIHPKGHQTVDSLTVGLTNHMVYETFHMSEGTMREVNYDIYLLVYHHDWETALDLIGPEADPVFAVRNPFNVSTRGKTITLVAGISDIHTGMSNISAAEYKEVPFSVIDPNLIDWSGAKPMSIGTDSPSETGIATWTPLVWDGGEIHRLCVRGMDEHGNWGVGSCTDVVTIGKRPKLFPLDFTFNVTGWRLISFIPPKTDNTIGSILDPIQGKYDIVRTFNSTMGEWHSYIPSKPIQTLGTVDAAMAFWIHITSVPATLTLDVNVSYVTEVTLQPGWNLVGYPSVLADAVTVGQLLSDPMLKIDRVEGFDESGSPYHLKELDSGYYLKPGEGYWMHVSSDSPVVWCVVGF